MLPPVFRSVGSKGRIISVRRTAAMGDCISATVVCDKLIDQGFRVTYAVAEPFLPVIKLHPRIHNFANHNFKADIALDQAYENHPQRCTRSFSELFVQSANNQLKGRFEQISCTNCRPRFHVEPSKVAPSLRFFAEYPKPWVIIVPSASPQWHGRHVPNHIWQAAAPGIKGTCFWLGIDPGPPGIVDIHCRDISMLAPILYHADLVISVDTGPMHLSAAIGKTVLAISQNSCPELHLSDQVDFDTIAPDLKCLNCQKNLCPYSALTPPCQNIDPGKIATAANQKLRSITSEDVSCVIPIWKPKAEMVNQCLEAILPQVSEVVITVDAAGVVPDGLKTDPKIRIVRARLPKIGFGSNVNHGARHTNGKYLLLLNDDAVLNPDAVSKMIEVMTSGVGMVGHLLYYPNKSIYHGGKYRSPGSEGWAHIDHRQFRPTVTSPQEMEQVAGTSMLVCRKAFFDVDGFDERFFLYCEDDDICMKIRKAAWKIMYTPHAIGIHEGGASTCLIGDAGRIMQQSGRMFVEKWRGYFEHNRDVGLGNFDYV